MTSAGRRSLVRTVTCAGGLLLLTAVGGTPTTSSFLYDLETLSGSLEAGTWNVIPEACGPPAQYHKVIIYGTDGPDILPIGGERPPPRDDQQPEPQPGNKGHVIFGLGGDDVIYGGNAKDCLIGGAGNDTIYGGNGDDVIIGGPGADELWGDLGPDDLDGDEGDDLLIGGGGPDELDGGEGTDTCYGGTSDGSTNGPPDTYDQCESGTAANAPGSTVTQPQDLGASAQLVEPEVPAEDKQEAEPIEPHLADDEDEQESTAKVAEPTTTDESTVPPADNPAADAQEPVVEQSDPSANENEEADPVPETE